MVGLLWLFNSELLYLNPAFSVLGQGSIEVRTRMPISWDFYVVTAER